MATPWYLEPEASDLLIRAGIEGITGTCHTKCFAGGGRDTWISYAETDIGARLNELHGAIFTGGLTREELIRKGAGIYADDAIEFAMGCNVSRRCVERPADFAPILNAISTAHRRAAA